MRPGANQRGLGLIEIVLALVIVAIAGTLLYRYVDQGVVDGAVNASGYVASESGHALQPVQSGKVNQYGALLFGGAMVGGIVLILLNV